MIFLKYSLCPPVPSRSACPSLPSRSARPLAFISSSPITVPAASFARPLAFWAAPGSCSATLFLLCPRPPLLLMALPRVCDGKTSIGRAGASKNSSSSLCPLGFRESRIPEAQFPRRPLSVDFVSELIRRRYPIKECAHPTLDHPEHKLEEVLLRCGILKRSRVDWLVSRISVQLL